jgi:hypothetical protein
MAMTCTPTHTALEFIDDVTCMSEYLVALATTYAGKVERAHGLVPVLLVPLGLEAHNTDGILVNAVRNASAKIRFKDPCLFVMESHE